MILQALAPCAGGLLAGYIIFFIAGKRTLRYVRLSKRADLPKLRARKING
jgi:hypothetical protein